MAAQGDSYTWSAVQVAYWLGTLAQVPSVDTIRRVTGCSRPTAYRWRSFACGGGQVPLPIRHTPARYYPGQATTRENHHANA